MDLKEFSKVRNSVILSTPPIYGTSAPVSCDVASMYPTMMASMNMGKSFPTGTDIPYFVYGDYPFRLVHSKTLTKEQFIELMKIRIDNKDTKPFRRRLDAEKHRLKMLIDYHKVQGNVEEADLYNNQYNNIEHDHPEWSI